MGLLQEPGFEHFTEPALPHDLSYCDEEEMAARNSDEFARLADLMTASNLRQAETAKHFEKQSELFAQMVQGSGKDKIGIPNFMVSIFLGVVLALVAWIFNNSLQTIQRDAEKLERKVETQETWTKNTREQLIAHGWQVDDQGNVKAPPPSNPTRK